MREILFRGKRKGNGEWIEGYYAVIIDDYNGKEECAIFPLGDTRINGDGAIEDYCFVIPETVGQFTGLTDKNGRKIFEGDIILYHHKKKKLIPCEDASQEEVKHYGFDSDSGLGLAYRPTKIMRYKGHVTLDSIYGLDLNLKHSFEWWWCEKDGQLIQVDVIGNVYDNPELVGGCNEQDVD